MVAQKKGKEGTKGSKQIVEENRTTLAFYRNMLGGALLAQVIVTFGLFSEVTGWDYFYIIFGAIVTLACYQFMVFMSKPTFTDSGAILDSGVDLNMEAGVAEHIKDIIILTCGCQGLSLVSRYFWLFWLLAPLRGFYYAWTKLIAPWVFAPGPEAGPGDEKKQRKMERRMRR